MKKIARKIAMILLLVMIAGSFTSCFTMWLFKNAEGAMIGLFFLTFPLDVVTLPFQLIAVLMGADIWASGEMETQIYLANAEYNLFTEYYSLSEKVYTLPEEELDSLKRIYNSIPETERISSMEKITSLSETRRASLIGFYNSLPESEIVSSIKRISALTETERVSLLRTFNSLSDAELDALVEEINSKIKTEDVALADSFITLPAREKLREIYVDMTV